VQAPTSAGRDHRNSVDDLKTAIGRLGVLAITTGKQTWFWVVADIVIGVLLVLNLLVIAVVHVRHLRESSREQSCTSPRFAGIPLNRAVPEAGPGRLCKPEVAGSIPARSITENCPFPGNLAEPVSAPTTVLRAV
jgi:hypothetical protein